MWCVKCKCSVWVSVGPSPWLTGDRSRRREREREHQSVGLRQPGKTLVRAERRNNYILLSLSLPAYCAVQHLYCVDKVEEQLTLPFSLSVHHSRFEIPIKTLLLVGSALHCWYSWSRYITVFYLEVSLWMAHMASKCLKTNLEPLLDCCYWQHFSV